jgi:glycerophosphoryl diester phosphodiesterase
MRRAALVCLFCAASCAAPLSNSAEDAGGEVETQSTQTESAESTEASEGGADTGEADSGTADPPNPSFDDLRVLNIAHRGGANELPEHTLLAYAHGIEVGADVVEIDLHLSADGVAVAIHDEEVDRTTDGVGLVGAFTLDELKALDAGFNFTLDDGETFPHRGTGLTIPTLEEILDQHPEELIAIEIKDTDIEIVPLVADAIAARDLYDEVYVFSFEVDITEALRDSDPQLRVGLTLAEIVALAAMTDEEESSYLPPGPFAQIPVDLNGLPVLDQVLTERCERLDIVLHAWTVNDPAQMQELIDWGVRGIITDEPSSLEQVLNDAGMP